MQIKPLKIFLLILFVSTSCSEKRDNDWKKKHLKGRVKYLKERTYKAINLWNSIKKGSENNSSTPVELHFNEDGQLTEVMEYNIDGTLKWKWAYNLCKEGKIQSIELYKSGIKLYKRFVYKYRDDGKQSEIYNYRANRLFDGRSVFQYDYYGKLVEQSVYHPDGTLNLKYKFNEDGDEKEIIWYHSNDLLFRRWVYKYDDDGKVLEEKKYGDRDSLYYQYNYKYQVDSRGNWIKKIQYQDDLAIAIIEREIAYYPEEKSRTELLQSSWKSIRKIFK